MAFMLMGTVLIIAGTIIVIVGIIGLQNSKSREK